MIRRFIEAWKLTGLMHTYSLEADTEFGWTNDDAANWKSIMLSDMGGRMRQKMVNYVFRVAMAATKKQEDRDYHCGIARGCVLTIANLEGLGKQPSPTITNDIGTQHPT